MKLPSFSNLRKEKEAPLQVFDLVARSKNQQEDVKDAWRVSFKNRIIEKIVLVRSGDGTQQIDLVPGSSICDQILEGVNTFERSETLNSAIGVRESVAKELENFKLWDQTGTVTVTILPDHPTE